MRLPEGMSWFCPVFWYEQYLQRRGSVKALQPVFCEIEKRDGEWVARPDKPWTRSRAEVELKQQLKASGCTYWEGVTLHSPRHTGRTLLIAMGLAKPWISKIGVWAESDSSDGYDHARAPEILAAALHAFWTGLQRNGKAPLESVVEAR